MRPIVDGEQLLMERLLDMPEGEIITHSEIEELVFIKRGQPKYYKFMRDIDKEMVYFGKGIRVIKGRGYMIIGAEAIVDKALKVVKNTEKKIGSALNLIEGIDRDQLNEEYKSKFDIIYTKFNQIHKNLAGGVKELILLDRQRNKVSKLQIGGRK